MEVGRKQIAIDFSTFTLMGGAAAAKKRVTQEAESK
jgi:hypothetical protein